MKVISDARAYERPCAQQQTVGPGLSCARPSSRPPNARLDLAGARSTAPARDQRRHWRETVAGAVLATVAWALATFLFGVYVRNVGRYGRTYGAIGVIIVLMIWFYIIAFAVLFGGELAAVLERRRHGTAVLVRRRKVGGGEKGEEEEAERSEA